MKHLLLLIFSFFLFSVNVNAQTSAELIGKWKLVKWTKKGKEKDILKEFKTDQVYQVFKDDNKFISVNGEKENKGKWKLSKENDILTIRSGIFVVDFHVDYFDAKKRIITADEVGTLEYEKVE
uniref:lipocalin family protein n=1 Tax=Pedobacter schmidteae TaxID=2201271 RepID=UPI000EAF7ADA|nr:lipocalin family protein [Pedobacter schmidteae]